ncbi:Glycerol kinase [bioreactor metagenome]|uniref:glycerol kinase n=1 Tax=bioreactor metagenome TaxID=1076179 RepID=A0A644VXM6_9ZZZZ
MSGYILALDQGTTSSRAILFDERGKAVSSAQYPFPQVYPKPGWVEHDPMEILRTQCLAAGECTQKSGVSPRDIAGVGITNQRETVVVWEKATGRPVYNAIVWQCRRTAELCDKLKADGLGGYVRDKTGLLIDAYFSGTKIRWILDHVPGTKEKAVRGELLCGTIDSWLIWNLTGGAAHVSDFSNCSRTMLFDIESLDWDLPLCRVLEIPVCMLPKPVSNSEIYGRITGKIPGLEALSGVPLCGAAGDQQAALFGQSCFTPGQTKNTYGTGCFTLMNVGERPARSAGGLLTSVGWSVGDRTTYCMEGSVFNAGSSIQWLRDELGLIKTAHECDMLAESVPDNGGVYLVSAFTGLGAPHWDMYARGAVLGITRGTTRAHLCRAALEGIAFQVADLMGTMALDAKRPIPVLRVDGGAAVSDFMMQFQADLLGIPVERPAMVETTALGAATLAGLAAGLWNSTADLEKGRKIDRVFTPETDRSSEYQTWRKAVERSKNWARV